MAVVLAAGEAVRMGTPKQVLPYGSMTLVETVVRAALSSCADDVVVVRGFHRDEVTAAVGSAARFADNPDPARGNMSTLIAGMDAVGGATGIVVLLSDMPQVSTETIDALVGGVVATGSVAGWVQYSNGRAHPIVLCPSILPAVRSLTGPKALWRYLESLDTDSLFVLARDTAKPIDVNTKDDYDALIAELPEDAAPPG